MDADKVLECASQFARDTKHKSFEDDPVHALKKMLVTQSPVCDWKTVYPFVANDMQRIEFRAPNQLQNYADHKYLQPGFLKAVLSANNELWRDHAVTQDFVEQVAPPAGSELVTFFLQGQKAKNMHQLLDVDVENAASSLADKICAYTPNPRLDSRECAREIGVLINSLSFPFIVYQQLDLVNCSLHKGEEEEEEEEKKEVKSVYLQDSPPVEWTAEHERDLRQNPVMQAFKKNTNLANQYPSQKVAKQILLSAVATPDTIYKTIAPILGKRQPIESVIAAKPGVDVFSEETWPKLQKVVDSLSPESIDAIVDTKQAQDYYNLTKKMGHRDKRSFVKSLLNVHACVEAEDTQRTRYLKRWPNGICHEIASSIVKG